MKCVMLLGCREKLRIDLISSGKSKRMENTEEIIIRGSEVITGVIVECSHHRKWKVPVKCLLCGASLLRKDTGANEMLNVSLIFTKINIESSQSTMKLSGAKGLISAYINVFI